MSKESLEHLSSLMDGELSRETSLFMARRLGSDEDLSGKWKRYHLIRDCIRQRGGRSAVFDLSERMRLALEQERSETMTAASAQRWLRPLSGLAIAASVAVMAIVAIGPGPGTGEPGSAETAGRSVAGFTSPNVLPAAPPSQPVSLMGSRETERRLNSYLVRHNQLAGSAGRQGFVSFVPIIATQSGETEAAQDEAATHETALQADPESHAKP